MGKLTDIIKRQKAHGEDLRAWLHDMEIAASKRAKEQAIERNSRPRGVDRVPKHLHGLAPTTKVISEQPDDNYRTRRNMALFSGNRLERTPNEVIPVMRYKRDVPGEVVHKQKSSKGRKVKGSLRSSANTPYVNPARSKKSGRR